jgi:cleavage and polyadenylation specificity factor subunit 1
MPKTMLLGLGKPAGRALMATSVPGQFRSRPFFILERNSRRRFLIDTGAEISVLPPTKLDKPRRQHGFNLQAANGTTILTYGQRSLTLNLGLRRPFRWIFTIADVKHPILGADFLGHHGLLVDIRNRNLVDSQTNLKTVITRTHQNAYSLTTLNPLFSSNSFTSLLLDYPELVHPFANTSIKHDVVHHIETIGAPVASHTRRLQLKVARMEFDHMLELGVIRPSSSSWSSALNMVQRKQGIGDHVVTTEH